MIWPNRIRTLLAALVVGIAVLPAAPASADRPYSLRYGSVERGDIAMAANTIVTCPEGAPNCANARNATGTVLRNSAWVMVPIDIDSDPATFDSSSADLKLPAGATVLYAGLYWGSDTKAMPEGVDAPNPAARGTMRLAAPDGAGYRTITASTVDSDRYFPHRYQGFADVTALVREAGAGTYTAANVQASTGKDQYGGWGLVVAYRDPSKPVRWLGLYDGFRDFGGDDAADVPITGFRTPPTGTVRADFGMLAYEGDLGVQPDTARINNRDLIDPLHALNNYWNASITDHGSHVTTRNPNYVNTLGMDANIIGIDGFLGNDATSAMLHMEVATDLVMPGAMTLVSDQAASAPASTGAPTASGVARDGQTLTAGNGSWSGTTPMTFSHRWRRCDSTGAACVDIEGATGSTYVLGPDDVNRTIRVQVTAGNVVSSAAASSAPTALVAARAPVAGAAPVVSGTARDGESLSSTTGSWSGTPTIGYVRQWQRCDAAGGACVDIAGATGASYVLVPADVGSTIRVRVTATNGGGSAGAASAASPVVAARAPVATAAPVVSGTARDGQSLTATDGEWTGTPTIGFSRQWQRCDAAGGACLDVSGATGTAYVLTAADVGSTIRVRVTGVNGGGSAIATSAPTAAVAARAPVSTGAPVVSGTARDGQSLTATDGAWTGTPTIAFARQWQRCDAAGASCLDLSGATGTAYVLTAADVGSTIRVRVTGVNGGGSASATSAPTAVVLARAPVSTAAPVVSGTARDGQSLTATDGSWTGTPAIGFSRQWRRCDSAGLACVDIAGAAGSAYELTPADVGHAIRVVVTATNAGGSATATSGPTEAVAAGPPLNGALPAITGTARDGLTLSASDGVWSGTPTISYTRRWRRCDSGGNDCSNIVGATGVTYALTAADVGATIRVLVTAANGGGERSAESAPTAVVQAIAPSNTTAPALSGTAREGEELALGDGGWTGSAPLVHSYAWERCGADGTGCVPIAGATAPRYTLVLADVGARVRGVVTAANAAGSRSEASAASAVVSAKPPPDPPTDPGTGGGDPGPGGDPGTGSGSGDPGTGSGQPGTGGDPGSGDPGTGGEPRPGGAPGSGSGTPGSDDLGPGSGSRDPGSGDPGSTPGGSTAPGGGSSTPGSGPAPRATLAAAQWKSSTGTGLRLRVASDDPIRTLSFTMPRAILPQRGDAGRVAGRIAVYTAGARPRTWTLRVTRTGGLAASEAKGPRVVLGRGALRVSALPAGAASVKLTLYTRDATSPKALVKPGHAAMLTASVRTASGGLEHLTHRLAPQN